METKICSKCGQEKPIDEFVKNHKVKSGRGAHCKMCHNTYYNRKIVKDAPKVDDNVIKECEMFNLEKISSRLLISELRRRGYRGELELVTIQKVVI